MIAYRRPASVDEACAALAAGSHRMLAGGTDVFPADAHAIGWGGAGVDHPDSPPILDLTALDALRGIRRAVGRVEIGALVTWTEAIESDLPTWFDGVRLAAAEIGGRQIQNRGTLAGNLCNASPAADGVPALLTLDAQVRLTSARGARELPLGAFITGNRRTALAADEILTHVLLPEPAADARSTFLKLGARRYLVISIAMVSVCLAVRDGCVRDARIAVGACSEVAARLGGLEARLEGAPAGSAASAIEAADFDALDPIDDVRASASYRRHGARVLVTRALAELAGGAERAA